MLQKVKDLRCWQISVEDGYRIPDRILKLTDRVADRYGIKTRQLNMKNYEQEILNLIDVINNCMI